MKKVYSVILCIIFVICLAGCKKSPEVTAVTSGLSFTAQIYREDTQILCEVVIDKKGKGVYTAVSPEQIKGFAYIFDGEKISVNYKEMIYSTDSPVDNNVFYIINSVFEYIRENNCKPTPNDKLYTFSGETKYGSFKLITSESGLPINAQIGDITVEIKDVSII